MADSFALHVWSAFAILFVLNGIQWLLYRAKVTRMSLRDVALEARNSRCEHHRLASLLSRSAL
jgi:hypothetical protein